MPRGIHVMHHPISAILITLILALVAAPDLAAQTSRPATATATQQRVAAAKQLLSGPQVPEAAKADTGGSIFGGGRRRVRSVPMREWVSMVGAVDLTESQRDEVEAITRELQRSWRKFNRAHGDEWREVSTAMREARSDGGEVAPAQRARFSELDAIRPRPAPFQMRIWNLLDDGQQVAVRRALAELRRQRADVRRDRRAADRPTS